MEMPASIAKHMPTMTNRAKITETKRLNEIVKHLLNKWAWLEPDECAKYLACQTELRARKHAGRKKKEGSRHVAAA